MFMVFSSNVGSKTVLQDLKNLDLPIKSVEVCRGMYEGVEEQAYSVHASYDAFPAIHKLVLGEYEQSALLLIDANKQCSMYTVGKGAVAIPCGTWRRVSQAYALSCDAYTRICQDYYVVE